MAVQLFWVEETQSMNDCSKMEEKTDLMNLLNEDVTEYIKLNVLVPYPHTHFQLPSSLSLCYYIQTHTHTYIKLFADLKVKIL